MRDTFGGLLGIFCFLFFSLIHGKGIVESEEIITDKYTLGACLQHASFLSFMKNNPSNLAEYVLNRCHALLKDMDVKTF
ncbi:hypothetical protein [Peribacillus frigoritolerans]|uniref:hypothetical protein n=1 Tax=Peribacillus frigoritolerans TaxID=450367 RepID=UPI002B059C1D|nr:hypothetical protein [Peribacillus frigoritolerans]